MRFWRSSRTRDNAYAALEARVSRTIVALLFACAAVAWFVTVRSASDMAPMARVGGAMRVELGASAFLGMWLVMMVAMMFPAVWPMVLAHRMVVAHRGEGNASTGAFVAGYLIVWAAAGIVPLAAFVAVRSVTEHAVAPERLAWAAGAVLVVSGAYQFTPWKTFCLRACRTPLGFILTHDFACGSRGALRAGIVHGWFCLGCCWALMAVLVVVGMMNLIWMALIALVFYAEKNWRFGGGLHYAIGSLVALAGLALLLDPSLLALLGGGMAPAGSPAMPGMKM